MRRTNFLLLALTFIVLSANSAYASKVVPGSSCKELNIQKVYKGKAYNCIKVGKKFVWDKGVAYFPKPLISVVSSKDYLTWNIDVLNYSNIKLDSPLYFSYVFSIDEGPWIEGDKESSTNGSFVIDQEFSKVEIIVRLKKEIHILQESDPVVQKFFNRVVPRKVLTPPIPTLTPRPTPTPTTQPVAIKAPKFTYYDLDAINSIIYVFWNGRDLSGAVYPSSLFKQINIWIKGGDFGDEFTKYYRPFFVSDKIEINVKQRVIYCVKLQAEFIDGRLSDFSEPDCLTVLEQPSPIGG